MKANEAEIGEAVASLTARLEALKVDDAASIATTYVNDMLRAGWRPNVRRPVETSVSTGPRSSRASEYAAQIRADLRRAMTAEEETEGTR